MRSLLPLFLFAYSTAIVAQDPAPSPLLQDDPIVARLDELAEHPWVQLSPFTTDTTHHNVHGFATHEVPTWPDHVVRERLANLDATTPFNLTFNRVVRSFIDLYTVRKRDMSARMLGLAELYFPVFEQALDRHGIPLEMKYLAVVESALNPSARSRAGAVGLWQFMLPTGKIYGLHADSYIDERHDVYKSTEAACRYLKHLHRLYNDWDMAMAAYNCGPGNVNKAIRRSGGKKGYWDIYDHLPRETRGYVPAFIAVNYLFAHHADHNIYPVAPTYCKYEMDTVQVCYPLDLSHLADRTGLARQDILDMNPTFKRGLVPDLEQPVSIYLPKQAAGILVANEATFRYAYLGSIQGDPARQEAISVSREEAPPVKRTHTVRSGESLGLIARKYGVSVRDLKVWNGLRGDLIRTGQRLVVRSDPKA